ncbi:hypothetical protein [Streptomyces yanii]|uniref:hypothetical protein n=1 Tax=Streptomyces yanii TaxID=78510 RepID=UPI0031E65693
MAAIQPDLDDVSGDGRFAVAVVDTAACRCLDPLLAIGLSAMPVAAARSISVTAAGRKRLQEGGLGPPKRVPGTGARADRAAGCDLSISCQYATCAYTAR